MAYLFDYGRGYAVMINSGKGKALRQLENCFLAEEAIAARLRASFTDFKRRCRVTPFLLKANSWPRGDTTLV